ncbi:MAG: PAS domain S-box protein, partial [Chthoniobacterales bacterium]
MIAKLKQDDFGLTDHQALLHTFPHGFALHEVLFNGEKRPYDYRFLMVNAAFEKITDLSSDDIMGKTVREILPRIEKRWKAFYSHAVITGCAFEFDEFNRNLSKHFRVYAYSPEPGKFAVIFYDVTHDAEEDVIRAYSQRWFQELFDAVPVMMLSVDERGKVQNVNQTFLEKSHWQDTQVIGRSVSKFIHFTGEDLEENPNNVGFWAQPQTLHLPCHVEFKDKQSGHFLVDCRRMRDPAGKILSICSFKELDSAGDLGNILEESEERFRSAFENSGIGMALISPKGQFLQVNRAFCGIVGYDVDELLSVRFQQITFSEDLDPCLAQVKRLMDGEVDTFTLEKRYVHKDGHLVWTHVIVTAVHDERGDVKYGVVQVQEITDRKTFEAELLRAKEAAEAGSRAKSAFLAQMSHEIRTPMNSIIAPANMLLEAPLDKEARDLVEMIQKSAEHLMDVINDILDYSKIEAHKMELEVVPFHLLELVQDAVDHGKIAARAKPLVVEARMEEGTPIIWKGDPSRIRQILFNLINNAVKFTSTGSIQIFAGWRSSASESGDTLMYLAVEDTGIGMSPEQRKHLFEAFQQADSSIHRRYGGTGLGLVICQKLVQLMGGTIDLISEIGKGTRVEILIPASLGEGGDIFEPP